MADPFRLCICSHEQERHHGLERKCLALACTCPYFSTGECECGHRRHEGRCLDFEVVRPGKEQPCSCDAWTKPVENVAHDPVNAPSHYTWHPEGIQQIQVSEHLSFNLGAAVKYIWRAGRKGDAIEDLRKAAWHIEREIKRLGVKG